MAETDDGVRVINLGVETELRFAVDEDTTDVTLQLVSGFAEIVGTELIQNKIYSFPPSSSVSLFTWKGCTVKLTGQVAALENTTESLIMIHVSIHACLEEQRVKAEFENSLGPVSMVVGPTDVGKTSFCYFLLNYAARMGRRPVFVDLDVGQSSVSMPGSICVMPVERPSDVTDGFDQRALSVYHFGHKSPGQNIKLYFLLIKKLGQMIKARMKNANPNTRSSGVIIDTCGWVRGDGYSAVTLAACSFEIDTLFVLEEERVYLQLKKDMPNSVRVVYVPKQHGVIDRDRNLRIRNRDNRVWEYFYGPRGNLNPCTIEVNFSDLHIYTVRPPQGETNIDAETVTANDINVESVSFGRHLERCILGLSFADKADENLMVTNIIGFVCVTEVDMNRKLVRLLSPQEGPLPSKICILGQMKLPNRNIDIVKTEN